MADRYIDIVFDGPPTHESGRFIEVEDETGASISFGEWVDRGDGTWALRIAGSEAERGVEDDEPERPGDDYYHAERDGVGNIRLNRGRGMLVAHANHTRADVQGWFDRSKIGQYREQYRAALALFDREAKRES
ncbi:hypothetical protein E3_0420 [Rhodococcus phage E3]|uniref:hypothetical protein n=1 Tax=Rhodococcus phage E3 TaxID=1007869 RepID=UPI0002C6B561|nr:hypothetical protein M176_gp045 [Rhodococcus phage E3]AEQ20955.1 hypothetical protein E3_0420 [Rhodococcus phage E3]